MKSNSKIKILCLGVISIVITTISCFTFMRPFFVDYSGQNIMLSINATGSQSNASLGNAVRVKAIIKNGSEIIDLQKIALSGKWIFEENMLECYNNTTPQELDIPLADVKSLKVDFIKQSGSGIVEVSIGDNYDKYDLYSGANAWNELSWYYEVDGKFMPLHRADLLIGIWAMFAAIVFTVGNFISQRK